MNLQSIAAGVIQGINPSLPLTLTRSTGYTTNADFTQTPTTASASVKGQVQALAADELVQVSALNLQGEKLAVYVNGLLNGVIRADRVGGDLLVFPDGSRWLVVLILEDWNRMAGWTKAAIVRQQAT